jgi:hypothetical protein
MANECTPDAMPASSDATPLIVRDVEDVGDRKRAADVRREQLEQVHLARAIARDPLAIFAD